jgi:hypothetical protein
LYTHILYTHYTHTHNGCGTHPTWVLHAWVLHPLWVCVQDMCVQIIQLIRLWPDLTKVRKANKKTIMTTTPISDLPFMSSRVSPLLHNLNTANRPWKVLCIGGLWQCWVASHTERAKTPQLKVTPIKTF